jgi:hypothetical protein
MLVVETVAKIRRAYFVQQKNDQGDLPGAVGFAQGRAEGFALGGDRVSLRV